MTRTDPGLPNYSFLGSALHVLYMSNNPEQNTIYPPVK